MSKVKKVLKSIATIGGWIVALAEYLYNSIGVM